ncbi:MAG TPA: PEP-CTERM sorting domain-containing protein, partial [Burkholderiaceae bacterium]|nr:PEP-CTERM sorting domain-containing protein [Burkholderiaceae bacterium]
HAADVPLAADNQWNAFAVDGALNPSLAWIDDSGSALAFDFDIAAGFVGTLTIVDAVFNGDTFKVTNFGSLLGSTSSVPLADFDTATDLGVDFDAALANKSFSSAVFTLGAGSYRIGGFLDQSLTFDGQRLDATAGALRLSVAPIPEPSTYALLLAGLGAVGMIARRRRS